jgi:hypothetical protein
VEIPDDTKMGRSYQNLMTSLMQQKDEDKLKAQMTKTSDNARRWRMSAQKLSNLREMYKETKKQICRGKTGSEEKEFREREWN